MNMVLLVFATLFFEVTMNRWIIGGIAVLAIAAVLWFSRPAPKQDNAATAPKAGVATIAKGMKVKLNVPNMT
jgi:hypothetical protein